MFLRTLALVHQQGILGWCNTYPQGILYTPDRWTTMNLSAARVTWPPPDLQQATDTSCSVVISEHRWTLMLFIVFNWLKQWEKEHYFMLQINPAIVGLSRDYEAVNWGKKKHKMAPLVPSTHGIKWHSTNIPFLRWNRSVSLAVWHSL